MWIYLRDDVNLIIIPLYSSSSSFYLPFRPLHFDTRGRIEIKPDFSYWDPEGGPVDVDNGCRVVGDCKYKRLRKKQNKSDQLGVYEEDVDALTPGMQLIYASIC